LWSGGPSRSRAAGRRFLKPVASYRSRCGRTLETWPTATGPVLAHAAPLMSAERSKAYGHVCRTMYAVGFDAAASENVQPMRRSERPQPALGEAVRQLRERRGMTQEAVARDAGITTATLSLIERGQANPTWDTLKKITAALGSSMGELGNLADKLDR
jgi:DNA-binding XRE family transcriptional regulator